MYQVSQKVTSTVFRRYYNNHKNLLIKLPARTKKGTSSANSGYVKENYTIRACFVAILASTFLVVIEIVSK